MLGTKTKEISQKVEQEEKVMEARKDCRWFTNL